MIEKCNDKDNIVVPCGAYGGHNLKTLTHWSDHQSKVKADHNIYDYWINYLHL